VKKSPNHQFVKIADKMISLELAERGAEKSLKCVV
jgi:hypothetical protein